MSAFASLLGLGAGPVAAVFPPLDLPLAVDRREADRFLLELPDGSTVDLPADLPTATAEGAAWRLTAWGLLPGPPAPLPGPGPAATAALPAHIDLRGPWPRPPAATARSHAGRLPGPDDVAASTPPAPTAVHSTR